MKRAAVLSALSCALWGCPGGGNTDGGGGSFDGGVQGAYYVFPDQNLWTHLPSLSIDPAGGLHLAYVTNLSGANGHPVRYAYCGGGCNQQSSWKVVELNDSAQGLSRPSVKLTPAPGNKPRVVWFHETAQAWFFSMCDDQCTKQASWFNVQLHYANETASDEPYFAISPTGLSAFVYRDATLGSEGIYYSQCRQLCSVATNWSKTRLPLTPTAQKLSLAFDSIGRVHLAYRDTATPETIAYAVCDGACEQATNWASVRLFSVGADGSVVLRLNTNDQPRLLYFAGAADDPEAKNRLFYASCDNQCTAAAGWSKASLGLPEAYGSGGFDFTLDTKGNPRAVYHVGVEPHATGYSSCKDGCGTDQAKWRHALVETAASMEERVPTAPATGCSQAYWRPGERPVVVLDANGNPRVAYEAKHVQTGGCSEFVDLRYTRVSGFLEVP